MSAFLCTPEHIGALAAFAVHHDQWTKTLATDLAELWARENLRSVEYRYPDLAGRAAAEFFVEDRENEIYVQQCISESLREHNLTPVQAIKMLQCLRYQSCELPDYYESDAHRALEGATSVAIRELEGYEDAPWSYDRAFAS